MFYCSYSKPINELFLVCAWTAQKCAVNKRWYCYLQYHLKWDIAFCSRFPLGSCSVYGIYTSHYYKALSRASSVLRARFSDCSRVLYFAVNSPFKHRLEAVREVSVYVSFPVNKKFWNIAGEGKGSPSQYEYDICITPTYGGIIYYTTHTTLRKTIALLFPLIVQNWTV